MNNHVNSARLLATSAIVTAVLAPGVAWAQSESETAGGLAEIIVTAQKRAQTLQDVPIAVTAIGAEALQANRVTNVVDLSGLAPGVNVRVSAGGSALPIFAIRGTLSYGVVPGSDKQVSIYLDGVYISSPRGSIFDLPDVERIEVLRGPQGTLFGRNATAGAVSIYTTDPTGEAGVKAMASVGNRDYKRYQLSASTPEFGPLSGYFSYVHLEKRGDIRNLGAGAVWNRTLATTAREAKIARSPEWLGNKDSDTWFAALKFESGDFKTVYKYDRTDAGGSPEATALGGFNPNVPLIGSFLDALIKSQPNPIPLALNNNKRPAAVSNSYVIPLDQTNQGHSLTTTLSVSDQITIKNVAAYRKSHIFATSSIDGLSGLTFTQPALVPYATFAGISALRAQGVDVTNPANGALIQQTVATIAGQVAPLIGQPFIAIGSGAQSRSTQLSDELQINYVSDSFNATAGALWLHTKDWTAEHRLQNTISFDFVSGGVLPNKRIGDGFNEAKSIAGYVQAELRLTPQLEIVAGGRITKDKKIGRFTYGANLANLKTISSTYKDTRFTYMLGANYKPTPDLLVYGKWSTGYVSGGDLAGISYDAETVKSGELGFKGEFLNRRVRTNLALWWAKYENVQGPQTATSYPTQIAQITGIPDLAGSIGTFVLDLGSRKSKGAEFEFDVAPARGLTLGGAMSYTDTKVSNVPAVVLAVVGQYTGQLNIPEWSASVYGQYESPPLFGESFLSVRADGIWTGDVDTDSNPNRALFNLIGNDRANIDAHWIVNGRVALRNIDFGGVKGDLAVWGRNLFDTQRVSYGLNLSEIFYATNYIPARSYGLDLTVSF